MGLLAKKPKDFHVLCDKYVQSLFLKLPTCAKSDVIIYLLSCVRACVRPAGWRGHGKHVAMHV